MSDLLFCYGAEMISLSWMEPPRDRSSDEAQHASQSHGISWLLWAPLVLFLYLLAIGPAVKVHRAIPAARRPIEVAYCWVDPLDRKCPPFGKVLRWYVEKVWGVK